MPEPANRGVGVDTTAQASSSFDEGEAARWFFDNASDLFAIVSPEGRFVRVNGAWTTLTGWSADELVGRPTIQFVHPTATPI